MTIISAIFIAKHSNAAIRQGPTEKFDIRHGCRISVLLLLSIALILIATSASAEGGHGKYVFFSDLYLLANPKGIEIESGVRRRWEYGVDKYGVGEKPYIQGAVYLGVNPSYTHIGSSAEWMPAPFAGLILRYDYYMFYGINGSLMSFQSGDEAFGAGRLESMAGEEEFGTGHRIMLKPIVRAKAGKLFFVDECSVSYFLLNGKGPYFREAQYDTLVEKGGDYVIDNLTMLPYEAFKKGSNKSLYAGPFYNITHAASAGLTRQRAGVVTLWLPAEHLWGVDRPRIYSLAGINLQDRNRDNAGFLVLVMGFDVDM